jgi:hypothetical protein
MCFDRESEGCDRRDFLIGGAAAFVGLSALGPEGAAQKKEQRLETCLAYSGYATPVLREALMSDAAVFQARRLNRTDIADQWLAAIPIKTQQPWFRLRAEAAILEAKGHFDSAAGKLAEIEAVILTLPKNAQRETQLRLLQRWKSDLCRC